MNLYSQKQIENNILRKKLFERIYDANHQAMSQQDDRSQLDESKV